MPNQTPSPGEPITELQEQLAQFRSTHPLRTKLPQSLWQSAAELARCYGVGVVARLLKLDYNTLKKHVSRSAESIRRQKKGLPKFVELIGAARQSVDEYLIEFESARGRKLRIQDQPATGLASVGRRLAKSRTMIQLTSLMRGWSRSSRSTEGKELIP